MTLYNDGTMIVSYDATKRIYWVIPKRGDASEYKDYCSAMRAVGRVA